MSTEPKLPAIVFLDIDGTILNSRHEIPIATRVAVEQLQQRGVRVGLATGRGAFAAAPIARELKLKGPHIVFAGALLVTEDFTPLDARPLDRELAVRIFDFLESRLPDFEIYALNQYYALRETRLLRICWDYLGTPPIIGPLPPALFDEPILKFHLLHEKERSWLIHDLEREFGNSINIFPAYGAKHKNLTFISLTAATAFPPNFLDRVWAELGKTGQVWAAGDGESDIPMLRAADIGIAMKNAHDSVKENADIVAEHVDEDGLGLCLLNLLEQIDRSALRTY